MCDDDNNNVHPPATSRCAVKIVSLLQGRLNVDVDLPIALFKKSVQVFTVLTHLHDSSKEDVLLVPLVVVGDDRPSEGPITAGEVYRTIKVVDTPTI